MSRVCEPLKPNRFSVGLLTSRKDANKWFDIVLANLDNIARAESTDRVEVQIDHCIDIANGRESVCFRARCPERVRQDQKLPLQDRKDVIYYSALTGHRALKTRNRKNR